MSEDDSSRSAPEPPERRRSWLERISSAFSGEPDTREDLVAVLRDAQGNGLIDADSLRMMEGALSVSELSVGDVMVARAQMVSLPADARFIDLMKQVVESGHSRFPVHGEDRDEILGILLAKDLLRGVVADNGPGDIHSLLRPAVLIPESKKLNLLLKEFRLSRNHMAIVVDEHGGVAGLVTIEDVLEEIVGEIEDEFDIPEDEGDIFGLADHTYRVSGDTPVERVAEAFGAQITCSDPDESFDTIGGLIAHEMGHVPKRGEEAVLWGLVFVVLHTKGGAVRWFKVAPADQDTAHS